MQAVLVGCGAMSKAWLEAARQIDGVTIAGLVDLDVSRAEARARSSALTASPSAATSMRSSKRHRPDVVFDVVVPAARRDRGALRLHARLPSSDREAARRQPRECARDRRGRARAPTGVHAVVQNRRYVANVRRIRRFLDSGAIGAPTSIHCDFFVAPHFGGFREEMRPRPPPRHGDPHLRCGALHGERRAAKRLLRGVGAEELLVAARVVGDARSSTWAAASSSPIAAAGAPTASARAGNRGWRIVGERGSLVWDGFDELRAEATTQRARGTLRQGRAGRRSAARSRATASAAISA